MAVEGGAGEGALSSLAVDSLEFNQNSEALSAEDLAWVDSCLVYDLEDSESNWDSVKDVLLEIVNNQPEGHISSLAGTSFPPEESDMEILPSNEKARTKEFVKIDDEAPVIPSYEAETMNVSSLTEEEAEVMSLLAFDRDLSNNSLEDAISSNDNGDPLHKAETKIMEDDSGDASEDGSMIDEEDEISPSRAFRENLLDSPIRDSVVPRDQAGHQRVSEASWSSQIFNISRDEIEVSTQDIFKVWDLDIPTDEDKEDEFSQQLRKALGDSVALDDKSINDLITGISDLSLGRTSA